MVQYTCIKCSRIFNHKGKYEKHLTRKNSCEHKIIKVEQSLVKVEQLLQEPVDSLDSNQCCSCYKSFANKSSRIRHENTSKCFYKKIIEDEKIKDQILDEPLFIHDEFKDIK